MISEKRIPTLTSHILLWYSLENSCCMSSLRV